MLIVNIDVNESKLDQIDMETLLSYTDQFITKLDRQWRDIKHENKPKFQTLVFPSGISYHPEKKFGTANLGYLFRVLEQLHAQNPSVVPDTGIAWNELVFGLEAWGILGEV